ncbi:hypothetical protein WN944_025480 [Citrus x changshan-huyou]|uniref:F-box domain-containing protein n=1 Tax=Citrus x changshan-huyou TaxID=2935761 RepID=A0AAP0LQH6_9ROSI
MSNLPDDVLIEVLSRLPVKSLLRFKCACKQWLSLISDPGFALLQYKRTARNSPPKILLSKRSLYSKDSPLRSFDCSTTSLHDQRALTRLHFPFIRPDSMVRFIGSCHGLICLALDNYREIFIWNPSTGAYTKLPADPDATYDYDIVKYGFGYDSSTNGYKGRPMGTLVNESLHWLTNNQCEFGMFGITAFDLATDKFSRVPKPDFDYAHQAMGLGVVGGRLCLLALGAKVELWVMKENGVKCSWQKLYCLGISIGADDYGNWAALILSQCCAGCGEDDIITMTLKIGENKFMIRYNPNQEMKLEQLMIATSEEIYTHFAEIEEIDYLESLISPPGSKTLISSQQASSILSVYKKTIYEFVLRVFTIFMMLFRSYSNKVV